MPAKRKPEATQVVINLPSRVLMEFDLLIFDPVRGRAKYGQRTEIVSNLITYWSQAQHTKRDRYALIANSNSQKEIIEVLLSCISASPAYSEIAHIARMRLAQLEL